MSNNDNKSCAGTSINCEKQFIESSLKLLKIFTFLHGDFFVFDVKRDLRGNK